MDTTNVHPETAVSPPVPARIRKPIVTPALLGLNVLVFVLMTVSGVSPISPDVRQVLAWGASWGPLTASGQWWRLLTACFLHFGIVHIGFNMYVLYQIGYFTEPLFGPVLFLLLYLAAGLGGNLLGLWLHPMGVSAGASGAIFGLYGGLLGFLLVRRRSLVAERVKAVTRSVLIFLGYNVVFGLADRRTDLSAHFGGLLTGFLVGCLFAKVVQAEPGGQQRREPIA